MEEVGNRSWNSLGAEEKEERGGGVMEAGGYHRAIQSISPKFCQQHSGYVSSKEATHLSMLCCSAARIFRCDERTPSSAHVETA